MKKQIFVLLLITSMCSQMANAQNYALTFDGTNDHVTLPSTLWHNNFSDGTAITVEYWYKKGDGSTTYNMNSVYRVQTGGYFVAGYYNGRHIISTDGSTNGVSEGDQSTILNGSWHHLAVTWSKNGYFTSYLDGVQVEQRAAANVNLPVMDGINSLASFNGISEFLNGSLDEVRIWNDVRTAQEIAANKDHELTGSEAGLVAYYKMSNGSGTGLLDNSASATYSGTLVNGPTWNAAGAPVSAAVNDGNYALNFNASSGTVTIPSSEAFNFATGDFTIEWWQYQTDNSSWPRIFYSEGLAVSIEGGTFYGFIAGNPNTNGAVGIIKNQWTHFAFTRTNGSTTVYKNGDILCTGTNNSNINNSTSAWYLGSLNLMAGTFFGGSLEEFRIWNISRTQSQVQSNMNIELAGNEAGLVAYYKMSNGSGSTLSDNTSNAHTGTLNAGVSWATGHPYLANIIATSTLSGFSACSGTTSSEQSFTASGSGLSANITVTSPTGFELSTTSGGSFSSSLTLTQTGGSVASTTIYVRMAASATGTPSGNITLASTGATTQNVAVSGTVNSGPVVNAGDDQTVSTVSATLAGSISGSATTGTWSGGAGTYNPDNITLTATYTPTSAERLFGTLTLTLTSADPEGPCGSASDDVILTFSSASKISIADGNWETADNWSPSGVPTLIDDVTVNHFVTVNSSLAADPAICNNLTINSEKLLTVASGKALTVNGILTNNSYASGLIINPGGSLIEHSGAEAAVQVDIPANEWHLISAPCWNINAATFEGSYLQKHSESSNAYTDITSVDESLTPVRGYALWGGEDGTTTETFSGLLNAGAKSFSTTADTYTTTPEIDGGWNLAGNPYPSSIDWKAVSGWTKTNVNEAIYLHKDDATWATFVGNTGTNGGTRYIAPCQGFFVQATAAGELAMTDAVRVHNSTSFFKNAEIVHNLIRLEVSGNGYKDEAIVRFVPESTAEFDGNYDAHKLFGEVPEAAQIYSLGSNSLAINSLPLTSIVPVGVKAGSSGTYTIAATEINDLQYATLEDAKTGIFTVLANNAYTFNIDKGENEMRFKLHFSMLGVPENKNIAANIYSYRKTAYINLKDNLEGDIFIYNIAGQQVAKRLSVKGMNEIRLNNTGNYIVKVVTDKTSQVKKIFIQ